MTRAGRAQVERLGRDRPETEGGVDHHGKDRDQKRDGDFWFGSRAEPDDEERGERDLRHTVEGNEKREQRAVEHLPLDDHHGEHEADQRREAKARERDAGRIGRLFGEPPRRVGDLLQDKRRRRKQDRAHAEKTARSLPTIRNATPLKSGNKEFWSAVPAALIALRALVMDQTHTLEQRTDAPCISRKLRSVADREFAVARQVHRDVFDQAARPRAHDQNLVDKNTASAMLLVTKTTVICCSAHRR